MGQAASRVLIFVVLSAAFAAPAPLLLKCVLAAAATVAFSLRLQVRCLDSGNEGATQRG